MLTIKSRVRIIAFNESNIVPKKTVKGRRYDRIGQESRWLVESDANGYMYTDPGVAFLICRKGRVVTLQAKALLEAERAVLLRYC